MDYGICMEYLEDDMEQFDSVEESALNKKVGKRVYEAEGI